MTTNNKFVSILFLVIASLGLASFAKPCFAFDTQNTLGIPSRTLPAAKQAVSDPFSFFAYLQEQAQKTERYT